MRETGGRILWLAYFDAKLSRQEGRRIPKDLAISSPSLAELVAAASSLSLDFEVDAEATHPRSGLKGRILVEKRAPKSRLLKEVGSALARARG